MSKLFQSITILAILFVISFFSMAGQQDVIDVYAMIGDLLGADSNWIRHSYALISKAGHVAAYGTLVLAFPRGRGFSWCGSVILILVLGLSFEFLQAFTATRQGLWFDMVYNIAGIGLALTILGGWHIIRRRTTDSKKP